MPHVNGDVHIPKVWLDPPSQNHGTTHCSVSGMHHGGSANATGHRCFIPWRHTEAGWRWMVASHWLRVRGSRSASVGEAALPSSADPLYPHWLMFARGTPSWILKRSGRWLRRGGYPCPAERDGFSLSVISAKVLIHVAGAIERPWRAPSCSLAHAGSNVTSIACSTARCLHPIALAFRSPVADCS